MTELDTPPGLAHLPALVAAGLVGLEDRITVHQCANNGNLPIIHSHHDCTEARAAASLGHPGGSFSVPVRDLLYYVHVGELCHGCRDEREPDGPLGALVGTVTRSDFEALDTVRRGRLRRSAGERPQFTVAGLTRRLLLAPERADRPELDRLLRHVCSWLGDCKAELVEGDQYRDEYAAALESGGHLLEAGQFRPGSVMLNLPADTEEVWMVLPLSISDASAMALAWATEAVAVPPRSVHVVARVNVAIAAAVERNARPVLCAASESYTGADVADALALAMAAGHWRVPGVVAAILSA